MFNIEETPAFTETVKVTSPDGTQSEFQAKFLALDVPGFAKFDLDKAEDVECFLNEVLLGADDIVDQAGDPVPFSDDLKTRLIGMVWVRLPLVRAYLEGVNRAARGN